MVSVKHTNMNDNVRFKSVVLCGCRQSIVGICVPPEHIPLSIPKGKALAACVCRDALSFLINPLKDWCYPIDLKEY